jgi:hypothetical protein
MRVRLLHFAASSRNAMNKVVALSVVAFAAAASFAPARAADEASQPKVSYFEEAKITVNERARAEGYLRVRITPEKGEAREATIPISKRESENQIAKNLAVALKAAVGADFDVDRDAGEHVKIHKGKRGNPNFSVEITFSAPGFSIVLDN